MTCRVSCRRALRCALCLRFSSGLHVFARKAHRLRIVAAVRTALRCPVAPRFTPCLQPFDDKMRVSHRITGSMPSRQSNSGSVNRHDVASIDVRTCCALRKLVCNSYLLSKACVNSEGIKVYMRFGAGGACPRTRQRRGWARGYQGRHLPGELRRLGAGRARARAGARRRLKTDPARRDGLAVAHGRSCSTAHRMQKRARLHPQHRPPDAKYGDSTKT